MEEEDGTEEEEGDDEQEAEEENGVSVRVQHEPRPALKEMR